MQQHRIIGAYDRLLGMFGTEAEQGFRAPGAPRPSEADLMNRAIDDAATRQDASTNFLRAALELAGLDQRNAETREVNLIAALRARGVSWKDIAHHRGLQSAQAAQQRYERLTSQPAVVIYAFRVADEDGTPWHGAPDALPAGHYQTATMYFSPPTQRPYSDHTLELRYGPAGLPVMDSHLRAYAQVGGRRVPATAEVQAELFGG